MAIDVLAAFEHEPPALDFIWLGFLAGMVGALVAPGATGKAAMSIACSVSCGDLLGLPALTIGASGMMRSASRQYPEMRNALQWRSCEAWIFVSAVLRRSRDPPGEAARWFQR